MITIVVETIAIIVIINLHLIPPDNLLPNTDHHSSLDQGSFSSSVISQLKHGAPTDSYRHVGDLGNIEAGNDGVAIVKITDSQVLLASMSSALYL